jgi:DHA2 family multidrug resistance protein
LCYFWYYNNWDAQLLIIAGFASFVVYHIMMYNSFVTDFNINDFWLPSVIKGFATALLYIAAGLYTTKALGINLVLSAGGAMVLVRSFLGSGVCSALYTYFLYAQRVRHLDYLAGSNDVNNFISKDQGAGYYISMQQQATLTAAKELTGYIILAGLVLLIILFINYLYQKLKNRLAVV